MPKSVPQWHGNCPQKGMRCLVSLLVCLLPLAAQTPRWSFGVTGGVPLGQMAPVRDESRRYTFGPAVEISLAERISVSVNPLYKRTGSSPPSMFFIPRPEALLQIIHHTLRLRAHSLELPVIGKYSFGSLERSWRPFAGAGFSFQSAWQTHEGRSILLDAGGRITAQDYKYDRRTPTDVGAVVSGGLVLRRGRLQFVPELRYTRWGSANSARDRHQAEALFSIRF